MRATMPPRLVSIIDRHGYTLYPSASQAWQTPSQRAELRAFAARTLQRQNDKAHRRALALIDAYDEEGDDTDLLAMTDSTSAQQPAGLMREELPTRRNPQGPMATWAENSIAVSPHQNDRELQVITACCAALVLIILIAAALS